MVAVVDGCMIQLREGDEVLSELWKPTSKAQADGEWIRIWYCV